MTTTDSKRTGKLDQAHQTIRRVVALDRRQPVYWDEYLAIASDHRETGDLTQALAMYRIAANMRARDPRVHREMGSVCYEAGRYAEAVMAFSTALQLTPGDEVLRKALAQASTRAGKILAAI